MTTSPFTAITTQLMSILTPVLTTAEIATSNPSEEYPVVLIELVNPGVGNKTFGRKAGILDLLYQFRCISTDEEEADLLAEQAKDAILAWNNNQTILAGGWACINVCFEGYIPKLSRAGADGVVYTQSGPQFEFRLQK